MYTKKERNQIYRKMYEKYLYIYSSIIYKDISITTCHGLCTVLATTKHSTISTSIDVYMANLPELMECKPRYNRSVYWFPRDEAGLIIRLMVLEYAINKTK